MYKLMYIDDDIDIQLSKRLKKDFGEFYFEQKYDNNTMDYNDLLNIIDAKKPNIVLIDQVLFTNAKVAEPYTGDEFRLILKQYNAFMVTYIITQNEVNNPYDTIKKHSRYDQYNEIEEYYINEVRPFIDKAIANLNDSYRVYEMLNKRKNFNRLMVEKIKNLLDGITDYNELKPEDIDRLVEMFKEVEAKIND